MPDFPRPGIRFRDITTRIGDAAGFSESVRRLSARAAAYRPDLIVAVEARGFLFGAAMATAMGLGVVHVRKAGKLPGVTISVDYELEYGVNRLALHEGALLRSEENTYELQSLLRISYAVFCSQNKKIE